MSEFLAAVGGIAGFCALASLLLKIFPTLSASLATWLYDHVDPSRLTHGGIMNKHWTQARETSHEVSQLSSQITDLAKRLEHETTELRKDTIKNTIIGLMADKDADHSTEIRYELDKLSQLGANCWVIHAAESYIENHLIKG